MLRRIFRKRKNGSQPATLIPTQRSYVERNIDMAVEILSGMRLLDKHGIPTQCQDSSHLMERREVERYIRENIGLPLVVIDREARLVVSDMPDKDLYCYIVDLLDEPDWIIEDVMVTWVDGKLRWNGNWKRVGVGNE